MSSTERRYWDVKIGWRPEGHRHGYSEAASHIGFEHAQTPLQAIDQLAVWRSLPPQDQWTNVYVVLEESYSREDCDAVTASRRLNRDG